VDLLERRALDFGLCWVSAPPEELLELLFEVFLVLCHSFLSVLINYHSLVELSLEFHVILASVHLAIFFFHHFINQLNSTHSIPLDHF
jgi:hypothetical protein